MLISRDLILVFTLGKLIWPEFCCINQLNSSTPFGSDFKYITAIRLRKTDLIKEIDLVHLTTFLLASL